MGYDLVTNYMGRLARSQKAKRKAVLQKSKKVANGSNKQEEGDTCEILRAHLISLGRKIVSVDADGNCMFRSLSDQLYGDPFHFADIRDSIVQYIREHQEELEPFIENEEHFEKYCNRMSEDGTWGGNLELYAAALEYQCNIIIHKSDKSRTTIECNGTPKSVLHLSYSNEEHYDSVRMLEDDLKTVPIEIQLQETKLPQEQDKICQLDTTDQTSTESSEIQKQYPNESIEDITALLKKFNMNSSKVIQLLGKKSAILLSVDCFLYPV